MNYKNIATILNSEIMVNALGASVTVAEDLSNVVELGTKISALTADQLKNYKKSLVVGVYNYFINRLYESKRFDILKDTISYGGALQRIMSSGLLTAQDSHLLNLINGQSYLDGKFYGLSTDSTVYEDTKAFKVVYSISDDEFAQNFTNAADTAQYIGLLMTTVENTVNIEVAQLEKRILLVLMSQAYTGGRRIRLLTEFNKKLGLTSTDAYSMDDIRQDRDLMAYFSDFCKSVFARITDYLTEINKKYNDGTVTTFTPKSDIKSVFITEFATDIEYLGNPRDYNAPDMPAFETVSAWQNTTTSMLPELNAASSFKIAQGEDEEPITYSHIVGTIYDRQGAGITIRANKVTLEPVGSEGFTNHHLHLISNYFCDGRLSAVIFTLD